MKLLCAIAAVLSLSAMGATYYVSPTGSNSTGDGSLATPWKDLRYALLQMSSGDTLNMRGGTYGKYLFPPNEFPSGVDAAHPTIVQAYQNELPIYQSLEDDANMVRLNGKSNIIIRGIEWLADYQSSSAFKIDGGSRDIVLTNCSFRACHDGHGLLISGLVNGDDIGNLLITHCRLITNGWAATISDAPLHQIYLQNSSNIIENCYIEGVMNIGGGTIGIHDFASDGYGNIFRNNFITNCSTGIGVLGSREHDTLIYNNIIIGGYSWGISLYGASNVTVLNNTCYTNNAGINVEGSTNCVVDNNITAGGYQNNPSGIMVNTSTGTVVRNNLAYGNYVSGTRSWDYREVSSTGTLTSANLFAVTATVTNEIYNANFVSTNTGNLRLQAPSSAINNGRTETLFTTDYLGVTRTVPWDIGAYEYASTAAKVKNAHAGGIKGK